MESDSEESVSESEHTPVSVDPSDSRVDRFMHCLAGEERFLYIDRLAEYSHLPPMPRRIVDGYKGILALRLKERGY